MTDLDRVERARREYTDKYVMVDATRPEMARQQGAVKEKTTSPAVKGDAAAT